MAGKEGNCGMGDVDTEAAAILRTSSEADGVELGEGAAGDAETACSVAWGFELNEIAGNEGRDSATFELLPVAEGLGVAIMAIGAMTESLTEASVACGSELNAIDAKVGNAATCFPAVLITFPAES